MIRPPKPLRVGAGTAGPPVSVQHRCNGPSRSCDHFRSTRPVATDKAPNLAALGKTGNGDWADCLAEMDYPAGQILDAIKQAGIEDNTLVVFTSDNGPEATNPWQGDSGPWRGTYFTAMEASLRAPFMLTLVISQNGT
jgi:arylsulfatase A-like enzyme